jgi:hypothetical protein
MRYSATVNSSSQLRSLAGNTYVLPLELELLSLHELSYEVKDISGTRIRYHVLY